MHWILGSLFCFFLLFSSRLYLCCPLKATTVILPMFSSWFSMWSEVFQGRETAHEEMSTVISYDQNSLLPIAFSFAVFWFLFFWFSFFAVQCLLSSFHFLVDLYSLFLASFSVLFHIVFPLFLFCPLSLLNILICGLDQCSSNFFKVLSLTGFHGNPRVPGVVRMSSACALLKLFYHHFTIPFECFH